MERRPIFSVIAKDCRWDYYRGSGSGGQKKNKTDNCCRCTHIESGAVGKAEDGRSKDHNRKLAFERMSKTSEFQSWLRLKIAQITGQVAAIEEKLKKAMAPENIRIESKEDGKWIEGKELKDE